MSQNQHQFTFIDVNAEKGQNSRKIKSHASTQINRQKRRKAVAEYQKLLLQDSRELGASSSTSTRHVEPEGSTEKTAHFSDNMSDKVQAKEDAAASKDEDEDRDRYFVPGPDEGRKTGTSRSEPWPSYRDWFVGYQIKKPTSALSTPNIGSRSDEKTSFWSLNLYLTPKSDRDPSSTDSTLASEHSIYVPRIDLEPEYRNGQWAPKIIKDFIRDSYESKWRDVWQNMDWYDDEDHELGVWRECFSLAVDFLETGKVKEAFSLINAGLSASPKFLKGEHPGLLLGLLKIMAVCSDIQDEQLRSMIRYHLVQLTGVTLESSHPILQIIKGQLNEGKEPFYGDDVLGFIMIDAITEAFGALHFLPVTMRFRMICRLIRKGEYDEALKTVEFVTNAWSQTQAPTSPLMHILKIERAKVQVARHEMTVTEFEQQIDPVVQQLKLELIRATPQDASLQSNDQAVEFSEEQLALLSLASKQFMARAYYALSLHMHAHTNEMFNMDHDTDSLDISQPDTLTFPTMVCRVILRHLRDETAQ